VNYVDFKMHGATIKIMCNISMNGYVRLELVYTELCLRTWTLAGCCAHLNEPPSSTGCG